MNDDVSWELVTSEPDYQLVLLARCRQCFRPIDLLICPRASITADQVAATAYWARRTAADLGRRASQFRNPCACGRELPPPVSLRSHIGRAVHRGLNTPWDVSAPITVRL